MDIRDTYLDPDNSERLLQEVEREGYVDEFEGRSRRNDGSEIVCLVNSRVWRSPDGEILGHQHITQDITERKRAEEMEHELRASEGRLNLALRAGQMATWERNLKTGMVTGAEDWQTLFGPIPASYDGTLDSFLNLVHPEDRPGVRQTLTDANEEGNRYDISFRLLLPGGRTRWLASAAEVYPDESGQPTRMIGIDRDITELKRAEEDLGASESRMRAILEAIPDLMFRISKDGTILDYRGSTFAPSLPVGQFLHKNLREVLPPNPAELWLRNLQRTVESAGMSTFEYEIEIDGTVHHREARMVLINASEVLVIVRDITERKQVEQKAAQLASIVESSDDAIVSQTLDNAILTWNYGAERLYGYSAEEAIGQSLDILIPPDRTHVMPDLIDGIRRGEHVIQLETRDQRKNGERFDASLTISPIADKSGNLELVSWIARDISRLKRAEQEYRRLNQELERRVAERTIELQTIQDSITDGLIVFDDQGLISHCNRMAEAITGFSADDSVGKPVEDVLTVIVEGSNNPEKGSVLPAERLRSVDGPKTFEGALPEPHRRELTVTAFPISLAPGKNMTGLLMRDVTRERDLERRRDSFVSVASHELRTPMTGIMGFSELLLTQYVPATTRRRWLKHINMESRRLTSILEELLDVSRIQSGKLTPLMESLSLGDAIKEVVSIVGATTDKHDLQAEIPSRLPDVIADRDKVTQVLTNLLNNAVKYSPQGGRITVSASHQRDHGRVLVSVADEGIGISPQDRKEIFTTFHRIRRPETESIGGTGLGLYIVKELATLMNGEVWVESEMDIGSTFFFTLPAA